MACGLNISADDSADLHRAIGDLAESLSSGEATQAMAAFSKKFPKYETLSEDFDALAGAYFVENSLDFKDEDVSATAATVTVQWDLALTTKQSGLTRNRSAELTLKLVREGKHWRIVEFGPIDIFDPQGG